MSTLTITLGVLVITLLFLNYTINKSSYIIDSLKFDNQRMTDLLIQIRQDVFMRYMNAESDALISDAIYDLIAVETALYGQSPPHGYWFSNRETLRANFELWGNI